LSFSIKIAKSSACASQGSGALSAIGLFGR